MAVKTGLGCTLGFGTTPTWTPAYLSIAGPNITLEALQSSHLGTPGYHTYVLADLKDGGEVTADFYWDALNGYPPLAGVAETITITNNDSGAATEAFSGFIVGFNGPTRAVGELQTASITIKVLGAITFTA